MICTFRYGDVDRMVFDCGPKQDVCQSEFFTKLYYSYY